MNKVKLKSGSLQAKAEEISARPPLRLPLPSSAAGTTHSSHTPKIGQFFKSTFSETHQNRPKTPISSFLSERTWYGPGTNGVRLRYEEGGFWSIF